MNIAICDDNISIIGEVERLILNCHASIGQKIDCECFLSGNELVAKLQSECDEYQIFVLDIEMPGMDGFEVAKWIRERDSEAIIIFLTSHRELMQNAFEVLAFHYLLKPIEEEKLRKVVLKAVHYLNTKKSVFQFRKLKKTYYIRNENIQCFESQLRKIVIHGKDVELEYYGTLRGVLERGNLMLFVQIHNSYIINMDHVVTADGDYVILRSGMKIPITKKYYQPFKQRYKDFVLMRTE